MYSVYREEGLQLPKRRRKRIRSAKRVPLAPPVRLNERWSMDFMLDMLADGRRFRVAKRDVPRGVLSADWFIDLADARIKVSRWQREYNERRPHSKNGRVPPAVFASGLHGKRPPLRGGEVQEKTAR